MRFDRYYTKSHPGGFRVDNRLTAKPGWSCKVDDQGQINTYGADGYGSIMKPTNLLEKQDAIDMHWNTRDIVSLSLILRIPILIIWLIQCISVVLLLIKAKNFRLDFVICPSSLLGLYLPDSF